MECDRNLCYTALRNDLSCAECEAIRSGEYYDDYDMTDSYISGCGDGFNRAIDRLLEIIERLNHNGSVSIKLLRKELEVLKGGEQG